METTKIDLGSWNQRTQCGCHQMAMRLSAACSRGSGSTVQLPLGEYCHTPGTNGLVPKLQGDPLASKRKMENDLQKLVINASETTKQHTTLI